MRRAATYFFPVVLLSATVGCLAEKEYLEAPCSPRASLEALLTAASESAGQAPRSETPLSCPELDRPPDGNKAAPGLVFEEYGALVAGEAGNFMDNGDWWAKALPRGEHHLLSTKLIGEGCSPVSYDQFSFDYAAATPPINDVPACGRKLVGVSLGHRFFQSSPQVLELDGAGYARLAFSRLNPVFGSSFRFATEDATLADETFPSLSRIQLIDHDETSLRFAAVVSGNAFEGVIQAQLTPGASSKLAVTARLFPRAAKAGIRLGVIGMSSMFWKRDSATPDVPEDEAHDADEFEARFADGSVRTAAIENPPPPGDKHPWQSEAFSADAALAGIALRQVQRDSARYRAYESARYAERPSLYVDQIVCNVPLVAELSVSHTSSEYIDNVVVNVFVAPGVELTKPIDVSYVLSASAN